MKKALLLLSALAVALLWGSAATVFLAPAEWGRYLSLAGLCFPVFVALVLLLLVVCLLMRSRVAAVPALGLLCCIGSLADYCPIHFRSSPPAGALRVTTYNTLMLGSWEMTDDSTTFELLRYVLDPKPDIVCFQEVLFRNDKDIHMADSTIRARGYDWQCAMVGINRVCTISRFPIIDNEVICHSQSNGAVAFRLLRPGGDTLTVVNAHLQSMGLSAEDRNNFHTMAKNPEDAPLVSGKRTILHKITQSGIERAAQADTLAAFLDAHKGERILVMGDFNDTPISYAHHQVCSRLTDCFRSAGCGIGRSFNRDAIYVRIDNVFCSPHFRPYAFRVDTDAPFSDHFPITGFLSEEE